MSEIPMKKAMTGSDAQEWRNAIAEEMKSIIKNETWILIDRPSQGKVIGSRMILRNELNPDGTIERRKARLIAQDFSQQPGIHFNETFAPVTRFSTIRLMASLAAQNNLVIRQFDIASAYLNGDLEEEITMKAPKFFEEFLKNVIDLERNSKIENKAKKMLHDFKKGNEVCLLKKSIYGLRQAGRTWSKKWTKFSDESVSPHQSRIHAFFNLEQGKT